VRFYVGGEDRALDYSAWDRYGMSFVVHHAAQAGRFNVLERLMTDLNYLEAKVGAGMALGLAEDFRLAVVAMPVTRPNQRILA